MALLINQEAKQLKDRLNELISKSEELKFLVGFFYFSGFSEIANNIRCNPYLNTIKMLVGLDVDEYNHSIIEVGKEYIGKSDKEIKEGILESFRKSFNADECDTREFYEQTKLFLQLFQQSKLELRKTREPNHSKLYLFKLKDNTPDTIAIVGSSNLTKPGLSKQNELNVEIRDQFYLNELVRYFDEQWKAAVKFNDDDIKNKIIQTIEHHSPIKSITPFEAFIYILYLYHHYNFVEGAEDRVLETFLIRKGYKPFKYQLDAVYQACKILEIHNGVILADVVGLGKSIIASLIGKSLKARGIVIAPPGLIGDRELKTSGWAKYLNDFELYDWEIFSSGKLEDAWKRVQSENFDVVIVDEAHKFRNENTESYALLQAICRGKKVILLTATPFNNRPSDVFAYLKLFTIPKKSTLTLNGNLESLFKGLEERFEKLTRILKRNDERSLQFYKMFFPSENQIDDKKVRNELKKLSRYIKSIIEPIIIRRNRLDLQNDPVYKKEFHEFPKVQTPIECFFELDNNKLNRFYDEVLNYFSGNGEFIGSIYRPDRYKIKNNRSSEKTPQRNLYDFMRRLLVKRFESSFYAFQKSIENFIIIYQNALKFISKTQKFILNRKVMNEILEMDLSYQDDEEMVVLIQKLLDEKEAGEKEIYDLNASDFEKDKFLNDIQSDIELFNKIQKELTQLNCLNENDPKLLELNDKLSSILSKKQKAIIFTEFVDTANYVYKNLITKDKRVLLITNKPGKELYEQILANFDASYPVEKQKNDYDILLVTDRFSEGYNLNRANHVFNFDIPWNPVRVIQRLGRINRIGTMPFKKLFIYNFFPTQKGEDEIKLRAIAETKMFTIHQCLGEDAQIFSEDEEPNPSELYKRLNTNPDELNDETSLLTKVRSILNENKKTVEKVKHLPRYIKVAKRFSSDSMVLAIKRTNMLYFFTNNSNQQPVSLEDIWSLIECSPDEKKLELSEHFWKNYEKLKNDYENYLKNQSAIIGANSRSSNDNIYKSSNIIRQLLRKNPHWLSEEDKTFLEDILIDIENFGTIPRSIVSKIAGWNLDNQNQPLQHEKILNDIEYIKQLIGKDITHQLKQQTKKLKNEIIICIENQKI
ncbi:MAG: hypothetical protein KatS3mg027_0448 [Bacteroidia bacterium]|nr:MAG: hypothetical protein KatS3mg027_0448 [Bacteroidia bacterium]